MRLRLSTQFIFLVSMTTALGDCFLLTCTAHAGTRDTLEDADFSPTVPAT
jgi:hypothetical protein